MDVVDGGIDLVCQIAQRYRGGGRVLARSPREVEPYPQAEESLLGALVDVALDPSALVVGAGGDSGTRFVQLAQEQVGVRREPMALERLGGVRGGGVAKRWLVSERGVVDHPSDDPVSVADLGQASPGVGRRSGQRETVTIDPAAGDPVDDFQR